MQQVDELELRRIIEALLVSATQPLSLETIQSVLQTLPEPPSKAFIKKQIESLAESYIMHAFEVKCVASGYRIQTRAAYSSWVSQLFIEKPSKYSRAVLETLAIIAYKQPVTRADIEGTRGVSVSSSIMKTLLERGWIRVAGFREVPGKPAVYVTTKGFLDYFNLAHLNELPGLPEIPELNSQILEECSTP
jgi:segregation and condensation protein B